MRKDMLIVKVPLYDLIGNNKNLITFKFVHSNLDQICF